MKILRWIGVPLLMCLALQGCSVRGGDSSQSATAVGSEIASIEITPDAFVVANGTSRKLHVTAIHSDGSKSDVTLSVKWTSSNEQLASVGNAPVQAGMVKGLSAGNVMISASISDKTAIANMTVSAATLTKIEINPISPTVIPGASQQVMASGFFSDGTRQDVSDDATWGIADSSIASVSDAPDSKGVLQGIAQGQSTIIVNFMGMTDSVPVQVTSATLQRIEVSPSRQSFAKGTVIQVRAIGIFTDNTTADLTKFVAWTVSDSSLASLVTSADSSTQELLGVDSGNVHLSAAYLGVTGSTALSVTAATLKHLQIEADNINLFTGATGDIRATGIFSDGTKQDLTDSVIWNSSDTGTVAISNAIGSEGSMTASSSGASTIRATLSGLSAETDLTVNAAALSHIELWPVAISIAPNSVVPIDVVAILADNTLQDITSEILGSIAAPAVAGVESGPHGKSTVRGLTQGDTTLSVAFHGVTANAPVEISNATVNALNITSPTSSIAGGTTLQLKAVAVFSDGTSQDVTSDATWTSSIPATASISNVPGSKGLVTGLSGGVASVTVAYAGSSAVESITVKAVSLSKVQISPVSATLAKSTQQKFTATAIFSDGSMQDVTSLTTWSIAPDSVGRIDDASESSGLLYALLPGTATVTAQYLGGLGTAALVVTNASAQSLVIACDHASMSKGASQSCKATATFSDNTIQDVTDSAMWTSSDVSVIAISNQHGLRGLADGIAAGSATITARYKGVSATTNLNVTPANIASITVTPNDPSIDAGATQQFQATVEYTDGTTDDVTDEVAWGSSDSSVATISNASGSSGLATPKAVGTTTISAVYMGNAGSTMLTVTDATGSDPSP